VGDDDVLHLPESRRKKGGEVVGRGGEGHLMMDWEGKGGKEGLACEEKGGGGGG
jgi:hypothetical protein